MSCRLCNSTEAELGLVEVCVSTGDDALGITGAELALVKLGLSACRDTTGFETLVPPFEAELERFSACDDTLGFETLAPRFETVLERCCRMNRALTAFAGTKADFDQLTSLITSK